MTEQTLSGTEGPGGLELVYRFVRWLALSLAAAWLAPFALIAVFAAFGLFGLTASDVRMNVVALATLDPSAWSTAGTVWRGYAWVCAGAVLLWRGVTTRPVQRLFHAGAEQLDAAVGPARERFERLPPVGRFTLFLALAVALGAVVFLGGLGRPHTIDRQPTGALPPLVPETSAALTLPSGQIRTGQVTIEQRGADTFVVVFKPAAAH